MRRFDTKIMMQELMLLTPSSRVSLSVKSGVLGHLRVLAQTKRKGQLATCKEMGSNIGKSVGSGQRVHLLEIQGIQGNSKLRFCCPPSFSTNIIIF